MPEQLGFEFEPPPPLDPWDPWRLRDAWLEAHQGLWERWPDRERVEIIRSPLLCNVRQRRRHGVAAAT